MLRSRAVCLTLLLILGAAGASPALAAARPAPPPAGLTPEELGDLRETVHLLMLSRLKRALDLSEEQERQLVPLLDELDQSRQEYRRGSRRALHELRRLLEADLPAERELLEAVRRARDLRRHFEQERQRIEQEISALLTPEQQARLLVFLQDFRRELRERLERVRRARPGPARTAPQPRRPPRPPGPPADEEWDEEEL